MKNGTEKQIAWAEKIRDGVLAQYDEEISKKVAAFDEYSCEWEEETKARAQARLDEIRAGRALCEATDDASWWINKRATCADMSYFNMKAKQ
jgi:hypothetical protein